MDKLISVIIVTYNSEKDIFDCIDSILHYNDIGDALEIIVVDNNSPNFDSTKIQLQLSYPKVKIVINSQNGGYGQGNNIGIAMASAPLIAVMNPDVRLMMPLFQSIITMFNNQPQIGMVGCKQMHNFQREGLSFAASPSTSGWMKAIVAPLCKRIGIYNQHTMFLAGACFFVRKALMEAIHGFDEHIFLYAEEEDIRYRILKYAPSTRIVYRKDLKYLHPMLNRPYNETTEQRILDSNIYVLKKQGISSSHYLKSEVVCTKLIIFMLWLRGLKQYIPVFRQKLMLITKLQQQ